MSIGIKCAPGVVGPVEADIDFDIIKNDNDTFTVKYTPPGAGHYTIMVLFANQVRQPSAAGGRGLAWKRSGKAARTELFLGQKAQLPRGCGVLCVCVCVHCAPDNTGGAFKGCLCSQWVPERPEQQLAQYCALGNLIQTFPHPGDPCQSLPHQGGPIP